MKINIKHVSPEELLVNRLFEEFAFEETGSDKDEIDKEVEEKSKEMGIYKNFTKKFHNQFEFDDFRKLIKKEKDKETQRSTLRKYVNENQIDVVLAGILHEEKTTTSGEKKMKAYGEKILKSNSFILSAEKLRKKYDIPVKLFFDDGERELYIEEVKRSWNKKKNKEYLKEVDEILFSFLLLDPAWIYVVEKLIFCNYIDMDTFLLKYNDLCSLRDEFFWKLIELDKRKRNHKLKKVANLTLEEVRFPIAIKISPFASERNIIDFIKKNFHNIRRFQNRYGKKLPINSVINSVKGRKYSSKERDDFIYNNKRNGLTQKEIKKLVKDKYHQDLEYEYIGKIVSRERKRRQDV